MRERPWPPTLPRSATVRAPLVREIPHTVSPGLWALAWRRLKPIASAWSSLAIVAAFIVMMILSGTGLIARTGRAKSASTTRRRVRRRRRARGRATPRSAHDDRGGAGGTEYKSTIVDPLGDVIASSKGGKPRGSRRGGRTGAPRRRGEVGRSARRRDGRHPRGQGRRRGGQGGGAQAPRCRSAATSGAATCCKKTIKGSETSIFVGLAAAAVATFLGTLFGAVAGYYGKWVDDFFNWFYSVFTSIPYLLLILAVAAVLQQKGMLTIVLILGLTGWTGIFRLIRAEYLKHKAREYVQAADAIGASNARRMFVHIFPNVSHVVLVQLSILRRRASSSPK